jgi:hypothetical protein
MFTTARRSASQPDAPRLARKRLRIPRAITARASTARASILSAVSVGAAAVLATTTLGAGIASAGTANYLGSLNPWNGHLSRVPVHGAALNPQGLLFASSAW